MKERSSSTNNGSYYLLCKNNIPSNKKVTYARMVCDFRSFKQENFRVCLTVGGDCLYYNDDAYVSK